MNQNLRQEPAITRSNALLSERMFGMIILHLWGISGTKAIYCSAPNAEQKSELQQTPHFRVDIMSGQNIAVTTPQAIQPSICM